MRTWHLALLLFPFLARLLQAETRPESALEFPVEFREGLLWVEVKVPDQKEPLHFLLDSGASASVVNLTTARRLGLALGPKVAVLGVGTSLTGNWPVKMSARAGPVELSAEFLGLDLGKLSRACSNSVDGLIGADFFRGRVVQIDYEGGKVRLLKARPRGSETIPLEVRPCGLRVPVRVNSGKEQWVRLDTGCATALQWVTTKISAERCTRKLAVGLAEIPIPQTVTEVSVGRQTLASVATGLHRRAIFPGEAGLLGNALLAHFSVVTIDCKSGSMILGRFSE